MRIFPKVSLMIFLGLFLMCSCIAFAQEGANTAETSGAGQEAANTAESVSSASGPVMEIKRLETEKPLYSFELRDADITDLFRILAHDYKLNLMVDKDVQGKVTASLTSVSLEEALQTIAESQNLILQKKGNIIKIIPNLVTKIFTLKYVEANSLLQSSGASSSASAGTDTTSAAAGSTQTQANTIYDLLSNKGKVFLGKQPNSVIVIDYPPNIEKVGDYFKTIDQRMASRVFKLKYLKASDVVGIPVTPPATSASSSSSATTGSTAGAGTSAAGGG